MSKDYQRLQNENDELKRELARLRNPDPRAWPANFNAPSDTELNALREIALAQYPAFRSHCDDAAEFKRAFIAVSHLPRASDGKLNLKIDKLTWKGRAEDVLR